jgi:hypothetical protein
MANYVNLDIKDMNKAEKEIVNAVIHEGEMRQSEKVIELLERKITEAYANDNRDLIDFLENLIVEIENI